MQVTAQLYGQFLVSSQVNYTGTYLADHLDGLTHDNVGYFLKTSHFTPRQRWQPVRPQVVFSARGYVLFDDTVLDKHHSRRIELVRRQYSGNAHGVIAGIGLVNCVYVNPDTHQFCPIDYRLFAPDGASWPRAALPAARCSWTAGTPPRPCSSGCWPPATPFTAR